MAKPGCHGDTGTLAARRVMNAILHADMRQKIEGEGLVYYDRNDYLDERQKTGDLYVSFEIVFPSKLDNEQKAKIEELLMA